jgi:hypothetical protein
VKAAPASCAEVSGDHMLHLCRGLVVVAIIHSSVMQKFGGVNILYGLGRMLIILQHMMRIHLEMK